MKKVVYLFMFLIMIFPVSSYALTEEENTYVVTLEKCVDGDTAKFKDNNGEVFTARLLAIDTPETVHPTKEEEPFGKEASNYTCDMLTNAKEIKIEYDKNSDEEDNYNRKLVWVFVDNALLQEQLVSKGYAEVAYLYGDYKYTQLLQDSQVVAEVNKVGIWSVDEEETKDTTNDKKVKKEEKSFLNKIVDDLLAKIFDFIDDLLEKILKIIEEML